MKKATSAIMSKIHPLIKQPVVDELLRQGGLMAMGNLLDVMARVNIVAARTRRPNLNNENTNSTKRNR